MIKNQLLIFIRNFQRNRLFSLINLAGLSIGICASILIYLYVSFELRYDNFHDTGHNIYRVNQTFIWGDNVDEQFGSTGPGVGLALLAEIPDIKCMTRIHEPGEFRIKDKYGSKIKQTKVFAVDSTFLQIFNFELEEGLRESALESPNSLILTASTANKYFGEKNALGQMLELELDGQSNSYKITAIAKDIPNNSHIQFEMLMSMSSLPQVKKRSWSWIWTTFVTYIELHEDANMDQVITKLESMPARHAGTSLGYLTGQTYDEYIKGGKTWELFLQPLSDIHFNQNVFNRHSSPIDMKTLYALSIAAAFILILSCINFTNLTVAQQMKRSRYIGIRKILGSTKTRILTNGLVETFIFCLIAWIIGSIVVYYSIPWFNAIAGQDLSFDFFQRWDLILLSSILLASMTLLSGVYPALILSGIAPIDAMKGKLKSGQGSTLMRSSLMVIQFSVSLILVACTILLYQQLRHTSQKDVGFKRENVISINNLEWLPNSENFVNEIAQIPGVQKASWCTSMPPFLWESDHFQPVNSSIESIPLNYTTADQDYIDALEIKVLYGRGFSSDHQGDALGILINEEAVKKIGWELNSSLIGKKIQYKGNELHDFKIIGIVKDFNFWSLDAPIEPFALFHKDAPIHVGIHEFAAVSFSSDEKPIKDLLFDMETKWKEFAPDDPFEYGFVDQSFALTFRSEEQFASILSVFSSMALVIASFGLLGIIIFSIEQRTKEIGMRKILGASFINLITLLSHHQAKMILISVVLSTPISMWIMKQWLEGYQYRIEISMWVFALAAGILVAMAAVIIGFHVMRASRINPIETIRDE